MPAPRGVEGGGELIALLESCSFVGRVVVLSSTLVAVAVTDLMVDCGVHNNYMPKLVEFAQQLEDKFNKSVDIHRQWDKDEVARTFIHHAQVAAVI